MVENMILCCVINVRNMVENGILIRISRNVKVDLVVCVIIVFGVIWGVVVNKLVKLLLRCNKNLLLNRIKLYKKFK